MASPPTGYLVRVKQAPSEIERYTTHSNRITGVVVMAIGVLGLLDILIEWRTLAGLTAAAMILMVMVLTYVGLVRPSVVLSPEWLLIRNHVRDHQVPWDKVVEVDLADIVRVETPERRLRAPGVQLVMRDLRKQRVRGPSAKEDSAARANFVVERIEQHAERYRKTSTGEIVTSWATPELIVFGALGLIALVTWLAG